MVNFKKCAALTSTLILCLFLQGICSKCTTTFITTCEKLTDVTNLGEENWQNLIIINDLCGKKASTSPNASLTSQTFLKTPKLEELYIVEILSGIEPKSLENLKQLTYLKLFKNNLKVLQRGAFSSLELFKLDLSYNLIENLVHGVFENSSISSMDLSNNKLTNLQTNMVDLVNLQKLDLSNNDLSYLAPNCFHGGLETLDLKNNSISNLDRGVLSPLYNLMEFNLSHNKIPLIPDWLILKSLIKFDLSHNEIVGIESGAFKNCLSLKYLFLGYNKLSYLSPNIFVNGNEIEILHLHGNRLISLDAELGVILSNIKEMSIGGNPWACPCLREIIVYFEDNNVIQPECERMFFDNGQSPVCIVTSLTCNGNETLTEERNNDFHQLMEYFNC